MKNTLQYSEVTIRIDLLSVKHYIRDTLLNLCLILFRQFHSSGV